jgi:hypothetical protein
VIEIRIATKGKVLAVLAFLFLASSVTIANASQTKTPFYFVARSFGPIELRDHWADDAVLVMMHVEEGIVEDAAGNTVGTITIRMVHIFNAITYTSTITAQFVIDFDSGAIIEGTMTFKVTYIGGIVSEGRFVGRGDMNVRGDIYNVPGDPSAAVLDGYSW